MFLKVVNIMNPKKIIQNIKQGKIFIYPTDTIYGIGCDATNIPAVGKIREIKLRDKNKPFSIIAPSIKWIRQNLIIPENLDIKKYLPGPYTMILKKINPLFLNHVSSSDSLGVRIPNSDFCDIIRSSNLPFITTSVNLSGEPFATQISEIPDKIKKQVDVIIDKGILTGKPSTLIVDGKEIERN